MRREEEGAHQKGVKVLRKGLNFGDLGMFWGALEHPRGVRGGSSPALRSNSVQRVPEAPRV